MTEALGKPEHPGRVRAVGQGVGIREHFGSRSHSTQSVINDAQLAALKVDPTTQIKEQVPQSIYSHQNFPICSPNTTQHVNTKGSFSIVPSMPDDEKDIPKDGELHIDGSSHVVPYANVYSLGSTTHNHELNNDMVRVPVTKVIGAKAQKPTFAEASAGSCLRETDSESGRRFGDEWTFEALDTPPCFGEFMTEAHFFS